MIPLIVQGAAIYLVSWTIWRLLRRFFTKHPLTNIPGPAPASFWTGNLFQLFDNNAWDFHRHITEKYGGVIKIKGMPGETMLHISDLTALYHILVKDQSNFEEETDFILITRVSFGPGIFSSTGEQHKKQRKLLTPVFSISNIREMLPIFNEVTLKLRNTLAKKLRNGEPEIDMLHWISRTALELFGQSGLGYSFDSLEDGTTPHRYNNAAKMYMPALMKTTIPRAFLLPLAIKIGTPRFQRFVINSLPWPSVHEIRDVIDTLHDTAVEIMGIKQQALAEGREVLEKRQVGRGKDVMSILLRENMKSNEDERMSDTELLAQIGSFTLAAVDTTTNALSRIFWILSSHPEAQEKLRQELVCAHEEHGELPYEVLVQLPYLDALVRETMRLFPPLPIAGRETIKDTIVPFHRPIRGVDGRKINEVLIPKGTSILVSNLGANCDSNIWGPDSYEWKPERWLSPLPDSVTNARSPGVYSHLMTFMGGGRACIGLKFAEIEMKVVLATLVKAFRFSPSDKEIFWQMSAIATPTVVGSNAPQLPLIVSAV